jgi:mannosyltransferase
MNSAAHSSYFKDHDRETRIGLIVLLTVAGAGLRLAGLGENSIWIDEYFTWRMVNPGPGHGFFEQLLDNHQNPLYMALVWPLIRDNFCEFMMRLPAFVAGVMAIPLIAVIGRQLNNARAGEWAALLLAVNPFHIWYSQEARGYTLAIFWCLLATVFLLRLYAHDFRKADALAFGAAAALAVLGNMSSLFLLFAQGLTTLFVLRNRGSRQWLSMGLALLIALLIIAPWLLQVSGVLAFDRILPGAATGVSLRGDTTFSPMALPYAAFTLFYGFSLGPSSAELHWPDRQQLILQAWPVLSIAAVVAALVFFAGLRRARHRLMLLTWILVPVLLLSVLALRNIKTFTPRYLAVCLPFLLVMLAAAYPDLKHRVGRIIGVLLLALIVFSLGNYHFVDRYAKPDMQAAADLVHSLNTADEPVLVPVVHQIFSLYYPQTGSVISFDGLAPVDRRPEAAQMMRDRMAPHDAGWLVLNSTWVLDRNNHWPSLLPELADIDQEHDLSGVNIYHWRRKAAE